MGGSCVSSLCDQVISHPVNTMQRQTQPRKCASARSAAVPNSLGRVTHVGVRINWASVGEGGKFQQQRVSSSGPLAPSQTSFQVPSNWRRGVHRPQRMTSMHGWSWERVSRPMAPGGTGGDPEPRCWDEPEDPGPAGLLASLRPASSGQLPNPAGSWWRRELRVHGRCDSDPRDSHVEFLMRPHLVKSNANKRNQRPWRN